MFALINRSLILKLLIALFSVLALSFSGLSFFILQKQKHLLDRMSRKVEAALTDTGSQARQSFDRLESHIGDLLADMKAGTARSIAAATREALESEQKKLQSAMESLLLKNAEGITAILDSATPAIIARKSYADLISYSKAAAATDEIVFTLFFDKAGAPLPGHLNLKDPRIKGYLTREKQGTGIEKVLKQSGMDKGVIVFESPIRYYGEEMGKTVICMNRNSVDTELRLLAERFSALNKTNGEGIKAALEKGSGQVRNELGRDLHQVSTNNKTAIQETRRILNRAAGSVADSTRMVIILVGLFCSVAALTLMGWLVHVMVVRPIRNVAEGLKDTAQGEGDLTRRLNLDRRDEIGTLAHWFDAFLQRLNQILTGINANAGTVAGAADGVLSEATLMRDGVSALSERATSVAAASEEMSANMDSVAAASEQAAANVAQVSDAAQTMRSALNRIASDCDRARDTAGNADDDAKTASSKVTRLGEAAKEISKVTEVITDIAEQTNLLALNATIEAARSGEAGRGFAVVAGEIKGLAFQTAQATQDIRDKIQNIQLSTDDTVQEVGQISETIESVKRIVTAVAGTIKEQSDAAASVADNMVQAASGIQAINLNVSESSQVSTEIARDIAEVNGVSDTMSQKSGTAQDQAVALAELSTELREMIRVFKISESA